MPPAVEVRSPNQWTAREFPKYSLIVVSSWVLAVLVTSFLYFICTL